ncbi:hypothetical protein [Streptomyces sp. NRRL B-24085]|uniref:hypothetical protein n=1 Tax=Streptomyces sp. NRRL B-24085 TaxID=1709476 RepID=UPI000AB12BF2|nr:hypothetical protein [Streptomyces sp. NRRL B-24085]
MGRYTAPGSSLSCTGCLSAESGGEEIQLASVDGGDSALADAYDGRTGRQAGPVRDQRRRQKTGDDERTRGTVDAAPLRIDGSRGNWDAIEALWHAGELTDDEFEDHFIDDVIVEDIGEDTDGWQFPAARTP